MYHFLFSGLLTELKMLILLCALFMHFFKVFTQLVLIFVGYHILWVQLEDMNMDEASEEVAVQLAAQGVIGKRVDEMESGFIMALDYMIELAEKDQDDKVLFQVIFSFFSTEMDYFEPIFSCIVLIITTFISTFTWNTFSNY